MRVASNFGTTLKAAKMPVDDLFGAIKSIPGAVKAIAQLVGEIGRVGTSVARIGTTKADQRRKAIENQTEHDTAISQAITKNDVAVAKAVTDATVKYIKANSQAIGERALHHGVNRIVKEQINREAVVLKTIQNLRLDPPQQPPKDVPSDDWLNLFGRYAENASSEKLREHWSQILEGEIRKPGTFSFVTLQLASILDERLATSIERVRPWIIDNSNLPLIGEFEQGEPYSDLVTLAGIGFLVLADSAIAIENRTISSAPVELSLRGGKIVILDVPAGKEVTIPSVMLTTAGSELLSVLPPVKQAENLPSALIKFLSDDGYENVSYHPSA